MRHPGSLHFVEQGLPVDPQRMRGLLAVSPATAKGALNPLSFQPLGHETEGLEERQAGRPGQIDALHN